MADSQLLAVQLAPPGAAVRRVHPRRFTLAAPPRRSPLRLVPPGAEPDRGLAALSPSRLCAIAANRSWGGIELSGDHVFNDGLIPATAPAHAAPTLTAPIPHRDRHVMPQLRGRRRPLVSPTKIVRGHEKTWPLTKIPQVRLPGRPHRHPTFQAQCLYLRPPVDACPDSPQHREPAPAVRPGRACPGTGLGGAADRRGR
jgi:hypothetical protein